MVSNPCIGSASTGCANSANSATGANISQRVLRPTRVRFHPTCSHLQVLVLVLANRCCCLVTMMRMVVVLRTGQRQRRRCSRCLRIVCVYGWCNWFVSTFHQAGCGTILRRWLRVRLLRRLLVGLCCLNLFLRSVPCFFFLSDWVSNNNYARTTCGTSASIATTTTTSVRCTSRWCCATILNTVVCSTRTTTTSTTKSNV